MAAFRASNVLLFRASAASLARRIPDPDLPSQVVLRAIKEHGPMTTNQIWEKVQEETQFRSKRHMKMVLDFLREQQRLLTKSTNRDKPSAAPFEYHLGRRPNIQAKQASAESA
mmetsp:Transcript_48259/g.75370  ORF Transcript_48259/g.75370 Transcript_48259/m.75370 type:complete len:113 (-) Transcript_48259:484-822(-)